MKREFDKRWNAPWRHEWVMWQTIDDRYADIYLCSRFTNTVPKRDHLTVKIEAESLSRPVIEAHLWCVANVRGKWSSKLTYAPPSGHYESFFFTEEIDAIHFKLAFEHV